MAGPRRRATDPLAAANAYCFFRNSWEPLGGSLAKMPSVPAAKPCSWPLRAIEIEQPLVGPPGDGIEHLEAGVDAAARRGRP